MSIIGNILWFVLGGWIIFLLYLFGGLMLCLTIIGIPFGVQCFRLSLLGLFPFGKEEIQSQHLTILDLQKRLHGIESRYEWKIIKLKDEISRSYDIYFNKLQKNKSKKL